MRVWVVVAAAIAAIGLGWLIVKGVQTRPGGDETSVVAHTVRWSSQADALTFDPHAQNEITSIAMLQQIYEPLVRRAPDLSLAPALALSWRLIEPNVWEFNLRRDASFQGGTPFSADDVVFSLMRAKSRNSAVKTFLKSITRIEKVDDHTIRLVTDVPSAILPQNLVNIFIMSKDWSERYDVTEVQDYASGKENFAVRHADGTGPFRLVVREPGVRTTMVRNPGWWGASQYRQNVERIDYRPIASDATRVAALLSGELNFILDPPVQDLDRIRRAAKLKVATTTEFRTIFFGMDQGSSELRSSNIKGRNPFADRRVREAIYRAIDVDAIANVIMRGQAIPAGTLAPPGVDGYSKALDARPPFSPPAARALLAQAGYPDGFDVTLDCPNNRYVNDETICVAVVGMLAQVKIRVSLDVQPKNIWGLKIENRATDFYMHGWGVPTIDSENIFSYLYRSDGPWNATGYRRPEADRLIDAISREPNVKKRSAMMQQLWRMVLDDLVFVPLHYQKISWAMASNLDMPIMPDNAPRFFWARFKQ